MGGKGNHSRRSPPYLIPYLRNERKFSQKKISDNILRLTKTMASSHLFHRYLSSISRQENILHPALVVDLVHDKCVDATESLYNRRTTETHPGPCLPTTEEPKEKQMVVFFSTAKINFCFLQAASVADSTESFLSPDGAQEEKPASVSLLAGSISGVTAKVLSVRRKPAREEHDLQTEESTVAAPVMSSRGKNKRKCVDLQSPTNEESILPTKKSPRHRNTMTTASAECAQIQFQLRKLCEKDDTENCVTTAIPEESSRCKFQVNNSSYFSFSEEFEFHDQIDSNSTMNLLMLECGLDNVSFKAGSECASGSEVLPKIRERRRASGTPSEYRKLSFGKQSATVAHGFNNPIFDREVALSGVRSNLAEQDRKSEASLSHTSSLPSSRGSLSSSSGNDSDKESDADDDVTKPLLRVGGHLGKEPPCVIKPEEIEAKDAELARRTDVTVNFTNIWFNLSSPSSLKTVPANYHLYNSLVTTAVPFVTAWIPPVTQLRQVVGDLEKNHQRFLNSVFACLLAQALPESGRIPKAVRLCWNIRVRVSLGSLSISFYWVNVMSNSVVGCLVTLKL